jgi:DNA-directed RNA polymerase sigma subunit (sigma70/sigma32)
MDGHRWLNWRVKEWEPDFKLELEERNKLLHKALDGLSDRSKKILKLRFGLDTRSEHSWIEIARMYDLSIERIKKIGDGALKGLYILLYLDHHEIINKKYKPMEEFLKENEKPPILVRDERNLYC